MNPRIPPCEHSRVQLNVHTCRSYLLFTSNLFIPDVHTWPPSPLQLGADGASELRQLQNSLWEAKRQHEVITQV